MTLPKIKHPTFELTVPSNGQKIIYRPFLSSDEKILLVGKESGETADIIRSISSVINNCVLTEDFDINEQPTFDMEYIFLKIRSKSIGNIVSIMIEDDDDHGDYKIDIDLEEVEMDKKVSENRNIEFQDGIGVIVNYPTPKIVDVIGNMDDPNEATEKMIMECIEKVYDEENVYPWKSESKEERESFLDNLSTTQKNKLRDFFNEAPKLHFEAKYTNKAGKEKSVFFNTLSDFFTLH